MKINFTLILILFFFNASPASATVYYSYVFGGGGFDALEPSNWIDGEGNSPLSFSNPEDEFHISPSEFMTGDTAWAIAGKLVLEDGATFLAGPYDHSLLLEMWANSIYDISVETNSYSYSNLQFGTLDNSSTFQINYLPSKILTLRALNYPNLTLAGNGIALITSGLTINGTFQIDGTTVTLNNTLTVNQNFNITSGTFNIGGSNTLNILGDLNISGGTFNGKPSASGATTSNITGNLSISNNGTFNGAGSSTSGSSAVYNIGGNFLMNGGTFNGVTANANANTNLNISGSFGYSSGSYNAKLTGTGTGIITTSLIGAGDIFSALMANSNQKLIIAGNYGLQSNFTAGNELTLASGNLNLNGHILTLNNALNITSGTLTGDFNAGITFGPASVGANLPAVTLGTLMINRSGQTISQTGNVTVYTTMSLSTGTLSIGANTLTIGGLISGSGTLTGGSSSNLVLNGSGSLSLPSITLQNLTLNRGTSDIVTLSGNATIINTLTLTKGQLDNSTFSLILSDNATISKDLGELIAPPTFAGIVNLIYIGNVAINTGYELPLDQVTLNNLTISKTGASGLTLNTDVTVNGSLTISPSSKLTGGSQLLTVKGNWINNGTFTPSTGTVQFAGSTVLSGSVSNTTFNNLSIGSGSSLTVPVGSTTSITGDFTLSPTASFNPNNGTIAFTGTGTQNIAGTNYYNLSSSNTGARVLNGTIGIANTFSPGTNTYITTGSTVDYNGTNQTISTFTYNNITLSNSGIKTPAGISLTANDITLAGTAVLAGNGKNINVAGNWTSYGEAAFSENGSKVAFNGSAPQLITTSGGEIFNDLTVNSSSTVSLNSLTTVNGILALTNGTLASGGNLTVNLNSGSIAYNITDAGTVTGNIKISKSVNATKTHYLACPLTGATANDFADNTQVINPSTNLTRLYEYIDGDWSPINDLNTPLAPFKAYSLYFTAPTTLDFTGTYNHGSVPTEMTFPNTASEFRMVGNPFPSTIDWNKPGWSKSNINNAIYYWNAATSKYATYVNGAGNNGGTHYIPSLQGFFVTTTGSGGSANISMTNNVRTTDQNPSLLRTSVESQPILKITAQSGSFSDETILRFSEDASDSFDGNLDALKLKNGGNNPNLFSLIKGKSYAINSLPLNYIDSTIPLKLEAPVAGTYIITADHFTGFDTTDIIIEDKLLNITYDLKSTNGYSVSIAKNDTTSRLFIKFRRAEFVTGFIDSKDGKVAVNTNGQTVNIYFSNIAEQEASISIFNVIGQEVSKSENVSIEQGLYTKNLNVSSGVYIVKVKVGDKIFTEKIQINN